MLKNVMIPLTGSKFSRKIIDHVKDVFAPGTVTLNLFRVAAPSQTAPEPQAVDPAAGAEPLTMPYYPYGPRPLDLIGRTPASEPQQNVESTPPPGTVVNQHMKLLEEELLQVGRPLESEGYDVQVAVSLSEDENIGDEIVRFAHEENMDLIAMATHAPSGLKRLIVDSVAEHVIRNVDIPLLIYRPDEEELET